MIEPSGESDATGDRVEFGESEAFFSEQQVGAEDAGSFVSESGVALELDEVCGFALVEQRSNPFGGFSLDGTAIQQLESAVELKQDAAERFEILSESWGQQEGAGSDAPVLIREKASRWKLGANASGDLGTGLQQQVAEGRRGCRAKAGSHVRG